MVVLLKHDILHVYTKGVTEVLVSLMDIPIVVHHSTVDVLTNSISFRRERVQVDRLQSLELFGSHYVNLI